MPARDLDLLTHAALEGGKIALRYWKRNPQVWDKGGSPVTEADLAVNDFLVEQLQGARPDYGWLSEETADGPARLACEACFIVDPIDGTRAFVAGEETFSISLAVAVAGVVTAGVVYLPALDRLYVASAASPALRDGQTIAVAAAKPEGDCSLLTTKANLDPMLWPGGVPEMRRAFRPSLAYRFCLVAEGRHDGMLTLKDAWEWDIAAGALIAARAGAAVTDRAGGALAFNRAVPQAAGVIAATPELHGALLRRLGK
ncbi:MAG: 3'(2'),5'-bisphosphate nucleotidase CysQ [Paracoccaceae bacterium]